MKGDVEQHVESDSVTDEAKQGFAPLLEASDEPDPDFAALSAEASRDAIARAFAAGLSITYMDGDKLIEKFPDGRMREIPAEEVQAMLEGRSWP